MKIHATAVIEEGAHLGPDCEVGPYCVIGANVRTGANCRFLSHAVVTGHTTMGDNNLVGQGAILGEAPQDFAYHEGITSHLQIGNNNTFREYVTIHRGSKEGSTTTIGDKNFLMCGVHVGHDCRVYNGVVAANDCLLAGYVEIMDQAVLGGGTVFHQFMRVGRLCMIRGGTRMNKDVPPFLVADDRKVLGMNAIGLKRAGLSPATRKELKAAFAHVYLNGKNVSQALAEVDPEQGSPEVREFYAFIRESKRGISALRTRYTESTDAD